MAKDKVRRLPGADNPPVEQPSPDERFVHQFAEAMEAYDQVVLVCARGGYVVDIIARSGNRHEVQGLLREALPTYDEMTTPMYLDEDEE